MKRLLCLFFVLATLFLGSCDFLGDDSGDGDGGQDGGQDQGLVVED